MNLNQINCVCIDKKNYWIKFIGSLLLMEHLSLVNYNNKKKKKESIYKIKQKGKMYFNKIQSVQ